MHIEQIDPGNTDRFEAFCAAFEPLTPQQVLSHAPDAHWLITDNGGQLLARCSLWWRQTPPLSGERVGCVGHYGAVGSEEGAYLLSFMRGVLRGQGCTIAVGPMNGSTWQSYRFITETDGSLPFFLEISHPEAYPQHFEADGFAPFSRYVSSRVDDLSAVDERSERVWAWLQARGYSVRSGSLEHFDRDLQHIYAVAVRSFEQAVLYSPVEFAAFAAQYEPLRPYLQADMILLAERDGQPAGFLFAVPDLSQAQRGQMIDTMIVKTLAITPEVSHTGLGSVLLMLGHQRAHQMGFRRVIHALMHEANASLRLSARYMPKIIRRYTLYARKLSA